MTKRAVAKGVDRIFVHKLVLRASRELCDRIASKSSQVRLFLQLANMVEGACCVRVLVSSTSIYML